MRIAIVGASGPIGLRMTERWTLARGHSVIPIVRQPSSLAVLSRMDLDWQVGDCADPGFLAGAMQGCEVAVHAAIGDARQIPAMAEAVYTACDRAGVRRLVVLSSSSVHGQNPPPGTNEASAMNEKQPIDYNTAKIRAERRIMALRRAGSCEVVFLRPSVVYGPRSRWITDCATQLLQGTAYLINEGRGICNAIYVDNLIHAAERAFEADGVDGGAFLVADQDTVTWRDFYTRIANHIGIRIDSIPRIHAPHFKRNRLAQVRQLAALPRLSEVTRRIPDRIKVLAKNILSGVDPSRPVQARSARGPEPTLEMALLQQCEWSLPNEKAEKFLQYNPAIPFAEGMNRSLMWLGWSGLVTNRDIKRNESALEG